MMKEKVMAVDGDGSDRDSNKHAMAYLWCLSGGLTQS